MSVCVGDYITIVSSYRLPSAFRIAYVCATQEQAKESKKRVGMMWIPIDVLTPETEGVWWARGTEGPDVDALRASEALR
jgi:hypothetical protein